MWTRGCTSDFKRLTVDLDSIFCVLGAGQMIERRIQHKLGRQRQRVIKRLRRAKEIREMEDKKNAMRLEQANQVTQELSAASVVSSGYRLKTSDAQEKRLLASL